MQEITFDDGVVEYTVNGREGALKFNPSDLNLATRFFDCRGQIDAIRKDAEKKAKEIEARSDEGKVEDEARLQREVDLKMKSIINETLGMGNDVDRALGGVSLLSIAGNRKSVCENFMDLLGGIITEGANKYKEKKINEAKLNREQRRAAQRAQ